MSCLELSGHTILSAPNPPNRTTFKIPVNSQYDTALPERTLSKLINLRCDHFIPIIRYTQELCCNIYGVNVTCTHKKSVFTQQVNKSPPDDKISVH
jgi:hypothetical protein